MVLFEQKQDKLTLLIRKRAELIAERAQRALAESVEAAPGVELGASVGVALCAPNDTRTTAELFRDADAAMYRAKTRATGRPGRTS